MNEFLILVDEADRPWGKLEKPLVHQLGILHRAFSVFLFNKNGELLMQQRADGKYHSAGLWANTCCSHPQFGEETIDAVVRRLKEEMGLQCEPEFAFSFIYKATLDNGLAEHEFDHVYFGISGDLPQPDKREVKDWKYMKLDKLRAEIHSNPENYVVWLQICLEKVMHHFKLYNSKYA